MTYNSVKDFIKENYTEYLGDGSFLRHTTPRTERLWSKCQKLLKEEREKGGVLDIDTTRFSGICNFDPGYIDKDNELIVGLQTDAPLKRMLNPYGGMRMVEKSLELYGYQMDEQLKNNFKEFRTTHNDGVFAVYPEDVRKARHAGLITGLPDSYGRGRIIGDYRRVALYGTDYLINQKEKDLRELNGMDIQLCEEVAKQIKALKETAQMAAMYGKDITKPAETAQEAIQAIYFAYLAGAKENNGAATSLGRVSTFIDIYIERDMQKGILSESEAQELIDQFVMKLRFIRHLRTPAYNDLFGGDPTWITESIGGMLDDEHSLVTKTSFRFLHTLINLGPSPEPNLTILWSKKLPKAFKDYCAWISLKTNSIQYENDDLMRSVKGNNYGIACCVSAMKLGEEMQFFGARCNLAKALLYAINGGKDENTGEVIIPNIKELNDEILDYTKLMYNYVDVLRKTAELYVKANNIVHYMHDKYAYEASQMALHNTKVNHLMAFGIAGFSCVVDSLSAIRYAQVKPIRNEDGIAIAFEVKGNYPTYGNNDDRADKIGVHLAKLFIEELKQYPLYKNAEHTLSILTITSNVMYGRKTGATPDGRLAGQPFAPGANPMHNREKEGALASLLSVSKIDYMDCKDGISNTFSILPNALGGYEEIQVNNLSSILDTYFSLGGHHLNVNALSAETLKDAYKNPELYPTLTIRVSGYAVLFNLLNNEQKLEVISRTLHGGM